MTPMEKIVNQNRDKCIDYIIKSGIHVQDASDVFSDSVVTFLTSYDSSKGASMRTHLYLTVNYKIIEYRRKLSPISRSGKKKYKTLCIEPENLPKPNNDFIKSVSELESNEMCLALIEVLSKKQKQAFDLFCSEYSVAETALILGVSTSRVNQLRAAVKQKFITLFPEYKN